LETFRVGRTKTIFTSSYAHDVPPIQQGATSGRPILFKDAPFGGVKYMGDDDKQPRQNQFCQFIIQKRVLGVQLSLLSSPHKRPYGSCGQ